YVVDPRAVDGAVEIDVDRLLESVDLDLEGLLLDLVEHVGWEFGVLDDGLQALEAPAHGVDVAVAAVVLGLHELLFGPLDVTFEEPLEDFWIGRGRHLELSRSRPVRAEYNSNSSI